MAVPFNDLNVEFGDSEVTFDGTNLATARGLMLHGTNATSQDGVGSDR